MVKNWNSIDDVLTVDGNTCG